MEEVRMFCFISKGVNDLVNFLHKREELTKKVFLRRAIRCFLAGDHKITPSLLIRKRSDPNYIKRDARFFTYIDLQQKKEMERLAEELGYNFSLLIFQALVDYCAELIQKDNTGIIFNKDEKDD